MWYDRDIDLHMLRTMNRPLPAGRLEPKEALIFGIALAAGSVTAMAVLVNAAAALLLALTILYYVFIYTVWLKRRTPQNIVIGGASDGERAREFTEMMIDAHDGGGKPLALIQINARQPFLLMQVFAEEIVHCFEGFHAVGLNR